MKVLVIASHPDDEILGCGGTMARLSKEGNEVHILILGEGLTSRSPERAGSSTEELDALKATARRSADLVGASACRVLSFPDNRFDTVPLLEIAKEIERSIDEVRPSWVFTQHGGDLNIDHVLTYRATLIATRPMGNYSVRQVCAYEVASSSEWAFQRFSPRFTPNFFVDISTTLECKIAAMENYETEARTFPHPRSPDALRAQAARWGTTVGCAAAEAFEIVRLVH